MSSTPSKQPTAALHPVSQVNFRLSQRPPSSQKKSRRQVHRTESIGDDDDDEQIAEGLLEAAFADDDCTDRMDSISCRDRRRSEAALRLTPLTMSSPMLSLGTAASTPTDHGMPTQRYQMISQKMMSLSHVSNSSNNTTSTPRSQLRKSILNPQFSPVSPSTGVRQEQHQHQNQRAPLLMLQSSRLCSSPKSPLRPVSVHQHSLVSATPSAQLPMRPLLSQRPPVPRESCVDLLTQAHHLSTPIPIQQQQHQQPIQSQVSTKRARRDGVAVAELRVAVSHTLSEYRLWWHCLNDNSHAMIHIHRPPASLRIHVYAAQAVMAPHLFSASGEVAELLAHDASASASALAAGQPLTVLLSLAVCAASVPRVAKQIADRLTMLETAETTEPLTVKIYQPWRMQGQGQGAHVSILTSRFHIE